MCESIHGIGCHSFDRKRPVVDPESGFTLLETSFALIIMMVAVLASAGLFAYAIRNNSGANDRELAMAVAQQQMEQLRNVAFTDGSLTATAGTTTTVTSAGRQYTVLKIITDSNCFIDRTLVTACPNGQPTIKTITTRVTPTGSSLGAVILRTRRSTTFRGPY
jgi:Tfp pilus assembly protein PilV